MRKVFILLIGLLLIIAVAIIGLPNKNQLSDKIIKMIDNNYDKENSCIIRMDELADFKWDKMLIYEVGSTRTEISEALGIEYKDSIDLESGIVFVYQNKIVYQESIMYNPERPSKFNWFARNDTVEPSYKVFTKNDAIFKGIKSETDGVFYYKIVPLKTKK